jgi:hypothetical protein
MLVMKKALLSKTSSKSSSTLSARRNDGDLLQSRVSLFVMKKEEGRKIFSSN